MRLERPAEAKKSVLIVDDDPGLRFEYRELLEAEGFEVLEAGDGRKALRWLANQTENPPSVILLDLSMPIMDGWDFLSVLRSQPHLRGIPVVLMSAYEPKLDSSDEQAIAAYLRKPFDPAELTALVRKLAVRGGSLEGSSEEGAVSG